VLRAGRAQTRTDIAFFLVRGQSQVTMAELEGKDKGIISGIRVFLYNIPFMWTSHSVVIVGEHFFRYIGNYEFICIEFFI
jgi:hypothetical protein